MDACGLEEHGRSTEGSKRVESGMAKTGEEDWTTCRNYFGRFRVDPDVER